MRPSKLLFREGLAYFSKTRTVEQLESYIRQEWENIPLFKVQHLVSSIPRCLQCCKKKGTLHSGKHGPVPTFLGHVTAIKFKMI